MYVLGISALYHDSAAVLLRDGEVVAASQEERFSRLKHDPALPVRAAAWCLERAGIPAEAVDWLVFYEKPLRKFERVLSTSLATFPRSILSFPRQMRSWLGDKLWLRGQLVAAFGVPASRILFCEHHLSHAASAFLCAPHEDAAILTVDGVGEWATTSLWRGRGTEITPLGEVRFPHSLGLLYSAFTAHLGFAVNEGEFKVMGMAAFGQPTRRDEVARLVRLHDDGSFSLDLDWFTWHWHPTRSTGDRFERAFGPARFPGEPFVPPGVPGEGDRARSQQHADLAASIQVVTEEVLLHLARHAAATTGAPALCLAGGVALNSVANGRLAREGPFEHLWVQPAAGDAGGALGAALWAWHTVLGHPRSGRPLRPDLGRSWTTGEAASLLGDLGAKVAQPADPFEAAAEDLAQGKVIGWFHGAHEWGPRALGHRSILADPRDPATRDRVNARVKLREPFRPFAPAVLAASAARLVELPPAAAGPARWMLATGRAASPAIGACTHVDGSARVQILDDGPLAQVTTAFEARTGVGAVLNTSFNLKGEPIVSHPVDALATFVRSGLDVLYVEGNRVERPPG